MNNFTETKNKESENKFMKIIPYEHIFTKNFIYNKKRIYSYIHISR
jgi:hypothetical protein